MTKDFSRGVSPLRLTLGVSLIKAVGKFIKYKQLLCQIDIKLLYVGLIYIGTNSRKQSFVNWIVRQGFMALAALSFL